MTKNNVNLKTKIIATLGPASDSKDKIRNLIKAGVNIFRFNFSHGSIESHLALLKLVRAEAKSLKADIAVMQDLPGPKIRVINIPDGGVRLITGEKITLSSTSSKSGEIKINYNNLSSDIKAGQSVLLDDGKIRLKVLSLKRGKLICQVSSGGLLLNRKGVNLPDSSLSIKTPTARDMKLFKFGLDSGFDFTAVSFVRNEKDVLKVKKYAARLKHNLFVIAKIEKFEAVENIDKIIEVSDGIMVARGDLGVELPIEEVPAIQRTIIDKCNRAGKPVITATEILDSMITRPGPTRAEATDVANAVLNGTDALMLSGETAIGKFSIEAVNILRKIAGKAESDVLWKIPEYDSGKSLEIEAIISRAAVNAARRLNAALIMTPTRSGKTARLISSFKPACPIIAFTEDSRVLSHINLSWGVKPYLVKRDQSFSEFIDSMINFVHKRKLARRGDMVVITSGSPNSEAGKTNLVVAEKI